MKKKIISVILLLVFICFTVSCYSIKQINLAKGEAWDQCGKVTTVFTRSGDLIEFSRRKPGIMKQNKIVGTVFYETGIPKKISIPIEEADENQWRYILFLSSLSSTLFTWIGALYHFSLFSGRRVPTENTENTEKIATKAPGH